MTLSNWIALASIVLTVAGSLLIPLAKWMSSVAAELRAINLNLSANLARTEKLHTEHDGLSAIVAGHEVRIVKLEAER